MNNSSFVIDYKGGGETCRASKRAGPDVLDVYMCRRGDYNFVSSNYCNGDALMIFLLVCAVYVLHIIAIYIYIYILPAQTFKSIAVLVLYSFQCI